MRVYQAHYEYPLSDDDGYRTFGTYGNLYYQKEECQREINDSLSWNIDYDDYCKKINKDVSVEDYMEWFYNESIYNPTEATIRELEIKESYIK